MFDKFLTALKSIQEIAGEKERKEEASFIRIEEKEQNEASVIKGPKK